MVRRDAGHAQRAVSEGKARAATYLYTQGAGDIVVLLWHGMKVALCADDYLVANLKTLLAAGSAGSVQPPSSETDCILQRFALCAFARQFFSPRMNLLSIITSVIVVSALISYLNHRFLKLPAAIGVVVTSVTASLIILVLGKGVSDAIANAARSVDFSRVLLDVMLGLLLFAMALHTDYRRLRQVRRPVIILGTVGVVISTIVFGGIFYATMRLLQIDLPMVYCFIFGALISPTDPISVASILKTSKISPRLEAILAGESMFNDAVGLVLFVTLVDVVNPLTPDVTFGQTMRLLAAEVVGGVGVGLLLGFAAYRLMRSIRDFQTIFLLSLALVLGISLAAPLIHASVPLAAVTAGLFIGNQSFGTDHPAGRALGRIWSLMDEILNTILFVLLGLQLVIIPSLGAYWLPALLSVPIVLLARAVSVSLPAFFVLRRVSAGKLTMLTWAGVRGGISVAMALSLPSSPYHDLILACCYVVVVFSVIGQGLTLNAVIRKVAVEPAPPATSGKA